MSLRLKFTQPEHASYSLYKNIQAGNIYWTPKETLQSNLLYYFIKSNYIAFLHLVKVVRDVFVDECQIWTRSSKAKLL